MRDFILTLFFCLACHFICAQNAPKTTLGIVYSAQIGPVNIPVTVQNFNNIGAVYLSVDYNYAVLQLTGATPNIQMPGFIFSDHDLGTGYHRITMGWYGNGLTLPDLATIMMLHFNFTGGYSEINFYDNGPSCEYADGAGQVLNDIPTWMYYVNGRVCGALPNPGPIHGITEVCQEESLVAYYIDPEVNATDYTWITPQGVDIIAGQHTNLIVVNFNCSAGQKNIIVYCSNPCYQTSPAAVLPIVVNSVPVAVINPSIPYVPYGTSVIVEALPGGTGSYSYHWSPEELFVNPDEQFAQTVNLYQSEVVSLLVTDLETGCQNKDMYLLAVQGGPLAINPFVNPDSICMAGSAYLYALASGGTGNYSYAWTSNPAGWSSNNGLVVVTPIVTTTYSLTVSDGVDTVIDSVIIWVNEPVSATISGNDTLCGTGGETTLTIDLEGSPPWDFVYTFGCQSVLITGQETTPCSIITSEAGTYTISYVKDSFCDGISSGEGIIARYPYPPTPTIELFETTLISSSCCGNQWHRNNTAIPGATGITYTATESGLYFIIVTRFSCVSDTSNVMEIVIPGIPETPGASFSIFPNPSAGQISISASMPANENIKATLISTSGSVIREYDLNGHEHTFTLDTSPFPPGIYLLKISTANTYLTKKILLLP